jgi:hypothetical protein
MSDSSAAPEGVAPAGAEPAGTVPSGAAPADTAPSATVEPAAEPPLPKPATWTVKAPTAPWCPPAHREAILGVLPPAVATRFAARCDRTVGHDGLLAEEVAQGDGAHAEAGAWSVVGASRRGRRHAHGGDWNEDAYLAHLGASRGVLVVADGAGSATWSRLGSAIAVDMVAQALIDAPALHAEAMNDALAAAVDALTRAATAMDVAPRLLRTTILAAAWEPTANGHRLVTTQVGDGSLVLAHSDGRIHRPAAGDGGEWSGEVHCFLPDPETMTRARAATVEHDVPDLAALLLVTDGIDDAFYPFAKHAPAILGQLLHGANAPLTGLASQATTPALLASPAPDATLHDWLGFEKRGENDDRTLAVALHTTASHAIAPWAPSASA